MGAARLLLTRSRQLPVQGEVPSPCVSVCRMDAATALCEGCFRTLEEVAAWGMLPEGERRQVWQLIATRARAALA